MKIKNLIIGISALIAILLLLASCSSNISKTESNVNINIISPEVNTVQPIANESLQKNMTSNSSVQIQPKSPSASESIVKMIDVTESGDACIVEIKGQKVVIDKGKSETVDGVTVHVLEVVSVHSQLADQDMCQLIIYSS